jgi:arsenate reductase
MKPNILYPCTGNSCRSQMAEGWARHLLGNRIEPYSAGIEAHGMNLNAVRVMREAGIDISGQSSKYASTLTDVPLDLVITVCGHADENCPAYLGNVRIVHVGFDDPPKLAKSAATEDEASGHYRRVRDETRYFIANKLSEYVPEPRASFSEQR